MHPPGSPPEDAAGPDTAAPDAPATPDAPAAPDGAVNPETAEAAEAAEAPDAPQAPDVVEPAIVLPRPVRRPARAGRRFALPLVPVLLVGFAAAMALLGLSYRIAGTPGSDPGAPFTPFWAGLLLWLVLACWALMRRLSTPFQRSLALVLSALIFSAPKFLRNPDRPLFFDELAHWGQTTYMERTGQVDRNNVVAILQSFPGLHALTTALDEVTHLPTWRLATVLLIVLRVITPLLVRDIARSAGVGDRAADLAGLVYLLNPGFMFFTGMFAYESLAIVFQLSVLALGLRIVTSRAGAEQSTRLMLLLGAGAAVTHHLTALIMVAFAVLVAMLTPKSSAPATSGRRVLLTTLGLGVVVSVWVAQNAKALWAYLGVFPKQAAEQFASLIEHLHSSGAAAGTGDAGAGSRGVLQNTGLPGYETVLALASVPLAVFLGAAGLWLLRKRLRSPAVRVVVLIALAYPASMPLVLTTAGAPGAHRSWPFSYEALAALIGLALATLASAGTGKARAGLRGAIATGLLAAMMIGNCASENHAVLRFPGVYEPGTEGRVQSAELIDTAEWAGSTQGGRVVSDYFTGGYVFAFGEGRVATGFPGWDLLFYPGEPKTETLRKIPAAGVGYLVVDRRLSTGLFRTGFYIDGSEPEAGVRTEPIPAAALSKFESFPWTQKVWSSTNYDVYRLDMSRWRDPDEVAGR